MASQALQRNQGWVEIQRVMEKAAPAIQSALPSNGVDVRARAQRAIRCAMTELRRQPKLLECDKVSILGSVVQACQLGLELDATLGHAYLVPYGNQCQMVIGYRGMIALALRSRNVRAISAEVVYEGDTFEVEQGTSPRLRHVPALKDRGEIVAAYAIAQLADGGTQFRVLTLDDIGKRKKASKASRSGPWQDWYDEMVRKTAVRSLCKILSQAPEAQAAAVQDEYAEAGYARATTVEVGYDALSVANRDEDYVPEPPMPADRDPGSEG